MQSNHSSSTDKTKRLRAVVVGGSLGGLCAALALGCVNVEVEVFEKSPHEMEDRGAGIVAQMELLHYLEEHGITTREAVSVPSKARQYLARNGGVIWSETSYQLMTSWSAIYHQLKSAFPDEHYHYGTKLAGFEQDEDGVIARFAGGGEEKCDLLVGADGANSTCRRQLLPDVIPRYAGYVAWRGVIEESEVPASIAEVFADKFTFFQAPHTHILCYLIPGEGGELSRGKRRLNWVWYWNVPEGDELRQVLTDKTGLFRDYSVPQGAIRKDLVEQQKTIAQRVLPEVFQHLFAATKEPFMQPIYDLSVPQMAFGRVCLIGDAAFVPRPHTAASTSKAATNAVELAKAVRMHEGGVIAALKAWEPDQLQLGNHLRALGVLLGTKSQFGHR